MRIYGKCTNCKNEIDFRSNSNTRVEFAMNEGELKKLNCKNCGTNNEIHVDELYAKESKSALIISNLILFIGTPLILYLTYKVLVNSRSNYIIYIVGGFLLIPVIVYGIIRKQERTKVNSFNHRKLKGRIHNIG